MTNEELIQKLNEMNIQVSFKGSDFAKFFGLAIAANVFSYLGVMGTIGYFATKNRNKKTQEENYTIPTSFETKEQ